jgi:hypothetical protein
MNWFGSKRFNNNEELMEGVKTWLKSQAAHSFDTSCSRISQHLMEHEGSIHSS